MASRSTLASSELPKSSRPQSATRHLDLSYREVDSGRSMTSTQLNCMLRKITPAIPLNPADRNALEQYEVQVNWLAPINARTELSIKADQIEGLIPPGRHMRNREPLLQPSKVLTLHRAE